MSKFLTFSLNKYVVVILISGFLTLSCSNSYVDNIDRGEGYTYQPGYPELRVAATGQIDESDTPTIIVSGEVVYGSLVYTQKEGVLTANLQFEIVIQDKSDNNSTVRSKSFKKTLTGEESSVINSQNVFRFEEIFEVKPGEYDVQVIVRDQTSGKQTVRHLETSLPNPKDEISHITEIRILGKNTSSKQEGFNQATTYDIPSKIDSLKFVFQVTNNNPDRPLEIQSRLLKFRSDTSIARPMHFSDYSPSSISYIGIDYSKYEEIQTSTRTLSQPGSVVIEFEFTDLDRGNYRLEVTSDTDNENELYKARDFSIKSANYPALKSAEELARPLYYIMSEKEHEKLMSIKNPDSLKMAIDRFWLSNINNSKIAKNVISLYYERVEEANKQFSNFKEGWKTDMGMMYILFGPPWYTDTFSDQMVWSYSYDMNDPEKNFLFKRSKRNTKFYPFTNYILQRSHQYYSLNYQQVEKWKSELILRDRL